MSNKSLAIASGFVRAPHPNGIGRYINQLQRITFKFCKVHGSCQGLREFIEKDMIKFARQNPGTVFYLKPRRHRGPVAVAEYLHGGREWMSLHNFTRDEIVKWVEYLRTRSGYPIVRFRKPMHTDTPSIQGVWTPFTHKDPELNVSQFPKEEISRAMEVEPSATEELIKMFKQSQLSDQKQS